MKNSTKRITLALILALVVAACGLFAVGCGDKTPDTTTPTAYTVKVVYTDGTAVDGTTGTGGADDSTVMVQICRLSTAGETVSCSTPSALSKKGEWSIDASKVDALEAGEKYHVVLSGLPEGCTYDETAASAYFTAPGTTTITVTKTEVEDKTETYTASAKDDKNNAVANAWLEMFYYADAENFGELTVVSKAKTDANGVATFKIEPLDGVEYYVQSAEYGEKVTDPALNYKYAPAEMNAKFENKAATFTYNYYPNAFNSNYAQVIKYSRVYKDGNAAEADDNENLTLSLNANEYAYFYFNPYVAPDAEEASEEDIANAQAAASGIYQITFAADPNTTGATMYYYYASTMMNADRMPTQIGKITGTAPADADDATLYTGNATVELELKTDALNARLFAIVADGACTVTVSVNRTGDAAAVVERTNLVDKTSEATKEWGEEDLTEEGKLTPVSLNSPVTVAKDANGYYHLNSADGPMLYVTLTQPLGRVNGKALSKLSEITTEGGDPLGETAYYFDAPDNETDIYNFAPMVATYAALVKNDAGVYPVTEELKEYLTYFGSSGYNLAGIPGSANNWLAPCQYFNTNTSEDSTQLQVGDNVITLTGSDERFYGKEYTFTSLNGGTYVISFAENESGNGMVTDSSQFNTFIGDGTDTYEFTLKAGATFKFTMWDLEGSEAEGTFTFTVNIANTSGSDEETHTLEIGENQVADTEFGEVEYALTISKSGWYTITIASEYDLRITAYKGMEDITGTVLIDFDGDTDDETFTAFPFYLEAGEYDAYVYTAGATFTLKETTEPKLALGNEGSELTLAANKSLEIALDSTAEANYTITIEISGMNHPDITVTIGGTEYTLNIANNYTVSNVTIAAGAKITFSQNSYFPVSIKVIVVAEA